MLELVEGEHNQGRVLVGIELHLLVEGIALQAQTIGAIGVHCQVVELFLGNAAAQQLGHNLVELGVVAAIGEVARVGGDAHIEARGGLAVDGLGPAQLHEHAIHQLASRRGMLLRYLHVEAVVGLQVVVDEHPRRTRLLNDGAQLVDAAQHVEVEAEYQVGLTHQKAPAQLVLAVGHNLVLHVDKVERSRHAVGHHHMGILAHVAQHPAQPQRGAHRIAVGRHVARDHYVLGALYKRAQLLYDLAVDC